MLVVTSGMLKTFAECPYKYNLTYNEQVEIPTNTEFSDVGKKIHALINYKYKGFDIRKQLQLLNLPENINLFLLWQNFLSFHIETVEKSEFTFTVPFSKKIILTGRVDAIRKTNSGFEILDWKTGNSKNIKPENDMQTIVYLFSIYNLLRCQGIIDNPVNLSLTYCFLKDKTSITVGFSAEKLMLFQKILDEETSKILSFGSHKSYNIGKCEQCSFKIVCNQAYKP